MKQLRVGVDNYSLFPAGLMPLEMVRWAIENGAEGVSFSGYDDNSRDLFSSAYLRDVKQLADDYGLYLEWGNGQHIPMDLNTFRKKEIMLQNRRAVGEAYGLGISIIRSCSGGLMRWKKDSPATETIMRETARELQRQSSLFRDNGVILAIETHFEFTTFELLKIFEMCDAVPGDYIGICLDTMNLLTMLEDPVMATERILPWVVSTHIKDGGIIRENDGFVTFPAPLEEGVIDLDRIISLLLSGGSTINLSAEDHGGSFLLPTGKKWFIDKFPDLSVMEFDRLYELADLTSSKMKQPGLSITRREDWPSIYEERTRKNLERLKIIRDRVLTG